MRQQKGLSQAELARLLGIGQSTIAMYEKNKRLPEYHLLVRLADFFGVSTDYLLGRTDQAGPGGRKDALGERVLALAADPLFAGVLREAAELTAEEKRTLAEYWELALHFVKSRKRQLNGNESCAEKGTPEVGSR